MEFRNLNDLLVKTPASGSSGPVSVQAAGIPYASLYIDYIYLDTDERRRFAQVSHEYLIEQVQYTGDESVSSMSNKIRLNFNHPVKELVWVVASESNLSNNLLSDYTVPNPTTGKPQNPVVDAKLQLNGHDRFDTRLGSYFNLVQPYQHHTNIPDSRGINCYSFGLQPEQHQPSGTCNFSRIDNASLNLTIQSGVGTAVVKIFAINYNVNYPSERVEKLPGRTCELCSSTTPVRYSRKIPVASARVHVYGAQNTLLFGKALRAFYTKHDPERGMWQRDTSGMVKVRRIGLPACLSSKPFKGMVRRQRLNGCWLPHWQLKIQSIPYRKIWGKKHLLLNGSESCQAC